MNVYKSYRLWNSIFLGGAILVVLLSALVIFIPYTRQWLNSLLCATACFSCVWFHARQARANQGGKMLSRAVLLLGIAEVILSVLFLRAAVRNIPASVGMNALVLMSAAAYVCAYRLLFVTIFPQAEKRPNIPEPDPLAEFPQPIREIMKAGWKQVGSPVAFSILACTLLGAAAYLLSVFIAGAGKSYLFLLPTALGYLVGCILGIQRTYKWQQWARASGASERELKAAAKAAHLWWPETREKTKLGKTGKFSG